MTQYRTGKLWYLTKQTQITLILRPYWKHSPHYMTCIKKASNLTTLTTSALSWSAASFIKSCRWQQDWLEPFPLSLSFSCAVHLWRGWGANIQNYVVTDSELLVLQYHKFCCQFLFFTNVWKHFLTTTKQNKVNIKGNTEICIIKHASNSQSNV